MSTRNIRENEEVRCHWAHDLHLVFEQLEFFECLYSYGKINIFILFLKKYSLEKVKVTLIGETF